MNIIYFDNNYYRNDIKFEVLVILDKNGFANIYIGCSEKNLPLLHQFGIDVKSYKNYFETAINYFIESCENNGDWD